MHFADVAGGAAGADESGGPCEFGSVEGINAQRPAGWKMPRPERITATPPARGVSVGWAVCYCACAIVDKGKCVWNDPHRGGVHRAHTLALWTTHFIHNSGYTGRHAARVLDVASIFQLLDRGPHRRLGAADRAVRLDVEPVLDAVGVERVVARGFSLKKPPGSPMSLLESEAIEQDRVRVIGICGVALCFLRWCSRR